MRKLTIRLDEDDFRCLVSGGCLKIRIPHEPEEVKIYLADIGFDVMDKAITDVDVGELKRYSDLERNNQVGWDQD